MVPRRRRSGGKLGRELRLGGIELKGGRERRYKRMDRQSFQCTSRRRREVAAAVKTAGKPSGEKIVKNLC